MAGQDDIKTSTIALIGFVGAIVIFAIIILLQVVYYAAAARQVQAKDVDQQYAALEDKLTNQQAKLSGYRWVDRNQGIIAVPIERAMELTVRDIVAGKMQPPPAGAVQPAAASEPPRGAPAAFKETKSEKP